MEKSVRDKHSSLLQTFVNYGREKFYNIGPEKDRMAIQKNCYGHSLGSSALSSTLFKAAVPCHENSKGNKQCFVGNSDKFYLPTLTVFETDTEFTKYLRQIE